MKKINICNLILRAVYAAIAFIPVVLILKALVSLVILCRVDIYLLCIIGFFVGPLLYVVFKFGYGFVAVIVDAIVNKR